MKRFYKLLLFAFYLLSGLFRPAAAQLMYALESPSDAAAFSLVTFNVTNPAQILSFRAISGLNSFVLTSIEMHPTTGQLYGLGILYGPSNSMGLFRLNLTTATTAVATPVGPALNLPMGPRYGKCGFAFTIDGSQLRVTTPSGYNYRLDPVTGALASTDMLLSYDAADTYVGQNLSVQGLAFANPIAGSSTARLVGIDRLHDRLVRLDAPASGLLRTVVNLGLDLDEPTTKSDLTSLGGPIPGTSSLYIMKTEEVYNGLYSYGLSSLYVIDPITAQPVFIGQVCSNGGSRLYLQDLAAPSGIVSATRDRLDVANDIILAPNPARSSTTITFNLLRPGRAELTVADNQGRQVAVQSAALSTGLNALHWETGAAQTGLYLLRLAVDGQLVATRKVILE